MAEEAPAALPWPVVRLPSPAAQVQAPAARAAESAHDGGGLPRAIEIAARPDFEGAMGLVLRWGPDYVGGSKYQLGVQPGFFLRYRRLTISNASGFSSVRLGEVSRGLGLDFSLSDSLRASLGLRFDRGRRSGKAEALDGIDNVRSTLRVRATATRELGDGWRIGVALSADALGRGGGQVAEVGVTHERRLSPHLSLSASAGLSCASAPYMRSYYGITPNEAAASAYPAYTPGSGLRDLAVGGVFRMEIDPVWTSFWSVSASHLLGPANASPLTTSSGQWSISAGVARRF